MITQVSCPDCGRQQNAPASRAGQTIHCRFCGEEILVPGAAAAPVSAIGGWRSVEPSPQPGGGGWGAAESTGAQGVDAAQPEAPAAGEAFAAPHEENHVEHEERFGPRSVPLAQGDPFAPRPEPQPYDRSERQPAPYSEPFGGAASVGSPVTTSRHEREAKAGRPWVSGHAPGRSASPLAKALPGLQSDSEAEQKATQAIVVAVLGWAFCFPISLVALHLGHQAKVQAQAEGRAVPQQATAAMVIALLNLGFVGLSCFGSLQ